MTKRTILFVLFLCCISGFSQKYEFDYLIEYELKIGNNNFNEYYLAVNSEDKSVIMEIGKNTVTSKYYAILFNNEKNVVYHFLINGSTIGNTTKFELERKYEIQNISHFGYNYLNIEEVEASQFKISALDKKKKKEKMIFEMDISLMKFPKDLSFIFYEPLTYKEDLTVGELVKQKLPINSDFLGGFVIKDLYVKNSNLKPYKRTLKNIKKTSLVINVD